MAASFVRQATGGSSSASTTGTVTITAPAAGNALVACIAYGSNTATAMVSGLSSTGATWRRVAASQAEASGNNRQEMWLGLGDTGTTITITFSATAKWSANLSEWSGLSGTVAYAMLDRESYDGVTAPAFPASWNADSILVTGDSGTALPSSTPNAVIYPVGLSTNLAAAPQAYWTTQDTTGGQVRVSATVCHLNTTGAADQRGGVVARAVQPPLTANQSTNNLYTLTVNRGASGLGLMLGKLVSGSNLVLASAGPTAFADGLHYRISLICLGPDISAQCQRLSDGFWLNSGGTFVADASGQTIALSVADTAATAAGYAGLLFFATTTIGGDVGVDDFVLDQAAVSAAATPGGAPATITAIPLQTACYGDLVIGAMNLALSNSSTNFTGTAGAPDASTPLTFVASGGNNANNVGMLPLYAVASGGVSEALSWTLQAQFHYAYAAVVLKAADPVPLGYEYLQARQVNACYRM